MEGCGVRDELMASIFCTIPVQPYNSFVASNPTRASNFMKSLGRADLTLSSSATIETRIWYMLLACETVLFRHHVARSSRKSALSYPQRCLSLTCRIPTNPVGAMNSSLRKCESVFGFVPRPLLKSSFWTGLKERSRHQTTHVRCAQPERFRITHPFHPLSGCEFETLSCKEYSGEQRVCFLDKKGRQCEIPLGWTDLASVYHLARL